MVVSIVLGRRPAERLSTRPSPIAELCACLHAAAEPRHHPRSSGWAQSTAAGLSRAGAREAVAWSPLWGAFRARYLLPLTHGPERGLDEELTDVAELPCEVFVDMTAQALVGQTQRVPSWQARDLAADPAARSSFLTRVHLISGDHHALARRLLDDPVEVRERLLVFLETFGSTLFDAEWARVRPVLAGDAAVRLRTWRARGPDGLADLPIAALRTNPPRLEFDKLYHFTTSLDDTPCLLVPSVHNHPHTIIKHYPGWPTVVQYPVAAEAGGTTAPPLDLIRQRLAVLSHPTRVRLCHDLLRRPQTTSDLAARLAMTTPQVSRHLRRLREAGLVIGDREGPLVRYRLATSALSGLGTDLLVALRR